MGSSIDPPAIRACLFDMDGLLLNTEDLYSVCTNTVLREYGRPDLPWRIKAQLQGRPGPEANRIFSAWAQLPITPEEYQKKLAALQRKEFPHAKSLPGVPELLKQLASATGVHIALATSSHTANFELKTAHLQDLFSVFKPEHRVMGDDPRIPRGRGKPAPDIYLLALETINTALRQRGEKEILPEECLVFEDSVPGVESGRRAGMQVVWCPHPQLLQEYQGREKEVLAGLTGEHKEDVEKEVEAQAEKMDRIGQKKNEQPGEIDDGRGTYLKTLEDFPYEKFGIKVNTNV